VEGADQVGLQAVAEILLLRAVQRTQPDVADTVGEGIGREARGGGFGEDLRHPGRRRAVGHHLQVALPKAASRRAASRLTTTSCQPSAASRGERLAHTTRGAGNQGNAVHVFS
jgi:hypothetical protein